MLLMTMVMRSPEFEDVKRAAARIRGAAVQTPVVESACLNAAVGARLLIKAENLQRTGSFKFRGAYNRLSQLSDSERRAGVVAWSSGNHAQGVAAAAKLLRMPAMIVMPKDAPATKIERTRNYGAVVIGYDRYTESREAIGSSLAKSRSAILVPSFDDREVIAGQGTCGLEFALQIKEAGMRLDILLVCCGGGGLIAGMSLAFRALSPETAIYSVEPAGFDDHARSLASGRREGNSADARSICDALLAPMPGELTFEINRHTLTGGLSVTDEEVRVAVRYAFSSLKLVTEPSGAVALAAALARKIDLHGKTVGVVLSGGNVDSRNFASIIIGS